MFVPFPFVLTQKLSTVFLAVTKICHENVFIVFSSAPKMESLAEPTVAMTTRYERTVGNPQNTQNGVNASYLKMVKSFLVAQFEEV